MLARKKLFAISLQQPKTVINLVFTIHFCFNGGSLQFFDEKFIILIIYQKNYTYIIGIPAFREEKSLPYSNLKEIRRKHHLR